MAVPKRKTSRSNTRHRRSQWKATAPDLVPVTVDGRTVRVPRRLVTAVHRGLVDVTHLPSTTPNRSTR
ncbi:50S ribosomal protein L32 [Aeromicrobium sp. Leaf350]|uniref:50S ribosomal protein L32 n=1 Tax=Aeromicrobium sp. Leaf350 TaxID=2876565 RepID=UPI001E5B0D33|nr:50S ribosomal protein L32 [Aeromicrobium sp. Leaf350]